MPELNPIDILILYLAYNYFFLKKEYIQPNRNLRRLVFSLVVIAEGYLGYTGLTALCRPYSEPSYNDLLSVFVSESGVNPSYERVLNDYWDPSDEGILPSYLDLLERYPMPNRKDKPTYADLFLVHRCFSKDRRVVYRIEYAIDQYGEEFFIFHYTKE